MRVVIGDVIGTTDGRYGEVTNVIGNQVEFTIFPDVFEPNPADPERDIISMSQVASVR